MEGYHALFYTVHKDAVLPISSYSANFFPQSCCLAHRRHCLLPSRDGVSSELIVQADEFHGYYNWLLVLGRKMLQIYAGALSGGGGLNPEGLGSGVIRLPAVHSDHSGDGCIAGVPPFIA
jgi:hypothetical protein